MSDDSTVSGYDTISVLAKLRSAVLELRMAPHPNGNKLQMNANNAAIQDVIYLIEKFESEIA